MQEIIDLASSDAAADDAPRRRSRRLALLLASVGLYGVLSYGVTRRRREIGLRMALGATRAGVAGLIVRHGLPLTGAGLAIGFVLAWAPRAP